MSAEKAGRPRDPDTERRILDAVLRQLAGEGYSRMSLDSVAAEAGASKPTLYRRWPTKAHMATAALRTLRISEPPIQTGSSLGDLTQALENFARSLFRPNGMALIGTVLAEEAHTPELLALFREHLVAPRRRMIRAILEQARKKGELRSGAPIDAVVNMMVGAFYARYLVSSQVPAKFAREVAEAAWRGVARDGIR